MSEQNEDLSTRAARLGYSVVIDELCGGKQRFRLQRRPGMDEDAGTVHTVGELRAWLDGFTAAMQRYDFESGR